MAERTDPTAHIVDRKRKNRALLNMMNDGRLSKDDASNSPSVLQRSIGRAKLCKFGRSLCECGAGCAYCASAVEIADGGAREKKCSKQMHVDFECNGLFGSRHGLKQCWYCARGIGKVVYNP